MELTEANLEKISNLGIQTPKYSRNDLKRSIVHIGLGNFHRAHQACYLNDLINQTDCKEWSITGLEIRGNPLMKSSFPKQSCLYTLTERSSTDSKTRVIGSIVDYVYAADDAGLALKTLMSEEVKIVSLTVTEKGYNQDKRTGKLDLSHPEILHDLDRKNSPKTAVGLISWAIKLRREAGVPEFTVMCCDNLSENGEMLKSLVSQFVKKLDSGNLELIEFVDKQMCFPNTMVDRITPATSNETRNYVKSLGIVDEVPVMSEDFIQWVIEDKFSRGRPNWGILDNVSLVADVVPYELIKLRILNAGHFALSYPAALLNIQKVDDAMNVELLSNFVASYMTSVEPSLPKGLLDVQEYKTTVVQRFKNPAISDQIERLLMDGSSKFNEFVCGALEFLVENGCDYRAQYGKMEKKCILKEKWNFWVKLT